MNESLSISMVPLKMGQMLDRAFRLYRAHFAKFVGIAAIAQLASFAIQAVITSFATLSFGTDLQSTLENNPEVLFEEGFGSFFIVIVLGVISSLVVFIISLLTQAALARGVSQALMGESFSIQSAYTDILPYLGKLLLQFLVMIGLGIAAFIWFLVPCVGWFTGLGIFIFYGIVVAFGVPILVLEQRDPVDSLSRAWYLLRQRFWPVVGYVLVLGLLTGVITGALVGLVSLGGQALIATNPSTGVILGAQLGQLAVTAIVSAVVLPLTMIAYLIFYFDMRVRHEGFDITLKSQLEAGLSPAEIVKIAPDMSQEKFMRQDDMVKFFLLTLGIAVLYFVIFSVLIGGVALLGSQVENVFDTLP